MSYKTTIRSTCKSCHGGCGVLVTIADGKISYLEGDPNSLTKGTMCAKGLASVQEVSNPNRLKYPLKRNGNRGSGKWKRIEWEEALDTIASRINCSIEDSGNNSVLIGQGTSRGHNRYTYRLARSIGTANYLSAGYFCIRPRIAVSKLMIGGARRLFCDYYGWGGEFPKTHISWGRQMEISNADGEMGVSFLSALEKAKNLIIIDPRATAITERANLWLQIRPGTDAALALGMMNIIINEGLYDKKFVDNWTYGFGKLKQRIKAFTPKKTSEITWIPKEKIIRAARMFANDTPGVIQFGQAIEGSNNSVQNIQSIISLICITGNIERPGSMMGWLPPKTGPLEEFALDVPMSKEHKQKGVGAEKYKLLGEMGLCHPDTVFKELKEKRSIIKVAHWEGGNPLLCFTNTKDVLAGILNLDFFSVADLYMSTLAEYADIVLPVAHWLETDDIWDEVAGFRIGAIQKAVEPPGEAWPDIKIFNEIGKRIAPEFWFRSTEEMLDYQLSKANLSWRKFTEIGSLSRTGKDQPYYKYESNIWVQGGGFPTPTKKVELYSTALESLGYDPLPNFNEPNESPYSSPDLYKEYPFILTTGARSPNYFHSQYRQNLWLRQIQPFPLIEIHPDAAHKYNIKEGDWVWIETPRGKIMQKAKIFAGIDPKVVMAQASWWYPEKEGPDHGMWTSNINIITSNNPPFDPALGCATTRALLCKIYKRDKSNN